MRAVDVGKDQSYFLSNVNDEQLKRVMFPIGNLVKTQVLFPSLFLSSSPVFFLFYYLTVFHRLDK